jgi:hypothetical protein
MFGNRPARHAKLQRLQAQVGIFEEDMVERSLIGSVLPCSILRL